MDRDEQIAERRDERCKLIQDGRRDESLEKLVNDLSQYANCFGRQSDNQKVAAMITAEHRYLQQEIFALFLQTIKYWADDCDDSESGNGVFYDARNEYTVKTCSEIVKHLREKNLIV
jgi:hypothetical protein